MALTLPAATTQNGQTNSNNSLAVAEVFECLSLFDHFVVLALKGLKYFKEVNK